MLGSNLKKKTGSNVLAGGRTFITFSDLSHSMKAAEFFTAMRGARVDEGKHEAVGCLTRLKFVRRN